MGLITSESTGAEKKSIFEGVTLYHWLVVIIASCGWLFDCMDQRIFILARQPAVKELVYKQTYGMNTNSAIASGETKSNQNQALSSQTAIDEKKKKETEDLIKKYIGKSTTFMILGWATGGIIFGILSDKWGRKKTMIATLLVYSGFTGLSGIAQNIEQFLMFRFLVGLGVGGMFGAATTLVAESVPTNFRSAALGSLQALSATGNIMGSLISLKIPPGMENFWHGYAGWRVLFFVGILPALLSIPIIFILREPEAWKQAKEAAKLGEVKRKVGSPVDLFKDRRWRRNSIVGLMLGLAGMIGLWGIGFYSPELISEALNGADQKTIDTVRGWGTALQDAGAFLGMMAFTWAASKFGRKIAFFISFILCAAIVTFVFNFLHKATDAYWMLPMMGFATLSVFAGYSIYFPELFPTRLRGTGVGFCYNTVRYLAAPAPYIFGYLTTIMPFRTVATVMSAIFFLGLIALIWAPETRGKPLPED